MDVGLYIVLMAGFIFAIIMIHMALSLIGDLLRGIVGIFKDRESRLDSEIIHHKYRMFYDRYGNRIRIMDRGLYNELRHAVGKMEAAKGSKDLDILVKEYEDLFERAEDPLRH